MTEADIERFEANRGHLTGVAYRMLGSVTDAEDAVQEAWLRWQRADRDVIKEPRGWLTTVTGRICLDVLRSARVRREAYVGTWLPEPIVERLTDPAAMDPGDQVARTADISIALLTVLERLTPEQRVAFVLHDVFDLPFAQIADVLETSVEAARQHASRARRAARDGAPRNSPSLAEQRALLTAFLRAAEHGDIDALLAILAPDTIASGDGGGHAPASRHPITGSGQVARFLVGLFRRSRNEGELILEPVLVNGQLGLLIDQRDFGGHDIAGVLALGYGERGIFGVYNMLNPEKLTHVPRAEKSRSILPL